jgi:hypothetical protein
VTYSPEWVTPVTRTNSEDLVRRIRTGLVALVLGLIVVFVPTAFNPATAGVGVQAYRTYRDGSYKSNIVHEGDTSDCCCITAGIGTLGYGARLCYLP